MAARSHSRTNDFELCWVCIALTHSHPFIQSACLRRSLVPLTRCVCVCVCFEMRQKFCFLSFARNRLFQARSPPHFVRFLFLPLLFEIASRQNHIKIISRGIIENRLFADVHNKNNNNNTSICNDATIDKKKREMETEIFFAVLFFVRILFCRAILH